MEVGMTRKLLGMVLCAVLTAVAFGQNATTSVRGIVTDPTGATVQDATVVLTNTTTQVSQEQKAGKNGEYNFVELQPATYKISVAAAGFGTQTKDIELLVSQPSTINFKLMVGSTAETVEVTASNTINFSDATIGNAINRDDAD
jgi:DNA/RNA endonuclease YhcR with UshA esterase domain